MDKVALREKVVKLRKQGKTYSEIQDILKVIIPKSTLSYWCWNIELPLGYQRRIQDYNKFNLNKARKIALVVNKDKRERYLNLIAERNKHLAMAIKDQDAAKIALVMLYLGEGAKNPKRGSLMFGNSDFLIVELFLYLLRHCYKIDESRFRCTLQCRADQDIKKLEKFWSKVTKIPSSQFYKARIDPRTINRPSKKLDYRGVCRIDYFSAEIFIELNQIAKIIHGGLWLNG